VAMCGTLMCFTVEEFVDFLASWWGVDSAEHGHSHGTILVNTLELKDVSDKKAADDLEKEVNNSKDSEDELDVETGSEGSSGSRFYGNTKAMVKMMVLFIGLLFHNIFVGLDLGIGDNDYSLFIAIIFHQFFEGLGLGSRIAYASLKHFISVIVIDLTFALACPVGIAIGLGVKSAVEDNDSLFQGFKGTIEGLSAGILIYISIMAMMRTYAENGLTGMALNYHRISSYIGLLFGAAVMAVIGIWA